MDLDIRELLARAREQRTSIDVVQFADRDDLYQNVEEESQEVPSEENQEEIEASAPIINSVENRSVNDILSELLGETDLIPTTTEDEVKDTAQNQEEPENQDINLEESIESFFTEEEIAKRNLIHNTREETIRFSQAEWFQKIQEQVIAVAGVGGIGSWLALIVAKLEPAALYLFDYDDVEAVNMAGQLYGIDDIGVSKVEALRNTILRYSGYSMVQAIPRRFESDYMTNIILTGFDNMAARNYVYSSWKHHVHNKDMEERKKCLFIDGRLTADKFQVLCITGEDSYYMTQYEERFLFPDSEAPHLLCSFKQTGYLANMIASIMCNLLVNFCANLCDTNIKKSLPFLTEYNTDWMLMTQEK